MYKLYKLIVIFIILGLSFNFNSLYQDRFEVSAQNNYCAICPSYGVCETINGQLTGQKCLYAHPDCGNIGLSWQPDASCTSQQPTLTPTPTTPPHLLPCRYCDGNTCRTRNSPCNSAANQCTNNTQCASLPSPTQQPVNCSGTISISNRNYVIECVSNCPAGYVVIGNSCSGNNSCCVTSLADGECQGVVNNNYIGCVDNCPPGDGAAGYGHACTEGKTCCVTAKSCSSIANHQCTNSSNCAPIDRNSSGICSSSSEVCCNTAGQNQGSLCNFVNRSDCVYPALGGWYNCTWCDISTSPTDPCYMKQGCSPDGSMSFMSFGSTSLLPAGCVFELSAIHSTATTSSNNCTSVQASINSSSLVITGTGTGTGDQWRVVDYFGQVLSLGAGNTASFAYFGYYQSAYVLQFKDLEEEWPLTSFVIPSGMPIGCGPGILKTAIGCIPIFSHESFAKFILMWGLRISGGIALVLMGYAGIILMSSAGNPQKVQGGKELFTAAIAGLLFIIFSAFLLRFIGVNILGIPGLGM